MISSMITEICKFFINGTLTENLHQLCYTLSRSIEDKGGFIDEILDEEAGRRPLVWLWLL